MGKSQEKKIFLYHVFGQFFLYDIFFITTIYLMHTFLCVHLFPYPEKIVQSFDMTARGSKFFVQKLRLVSGYVKNKGGCVFC